MGRAVEACPGMNELRPRQSANAHAGRLSRCRHGSHACWDLSVGGQQPDCGLCRLAPSLLPPPPLLPACTEIVTGELPMRGQLRDPQ